MPKQNLDRLPPPAHGRRDFLRMLGSAALSAGLLGEFSCSAGAVDPKKFRGIFPIVQTPYTKDNKIAFDELEKEVKFLDRTGVHGIVWPQRASEYQYLSFEERIEGAELIVNANKVLKPVVVIGVQGPDTETAVKYAKHAEKLRPDAIVALPTRDRGEFVLKMADEVPTLRFVKDEAGHSMSRIKAFGAEGGDRVTVFTGSHGRNLPDEMMLGVAGNMPASGWVDLYVKVWDLMNEGKTNEALDAFSKIMLFVTQAVAYGFPSLLYVLHLRGVVSNWEVRNPDVRPLDEDAMKAIRQTYEFVKPHFVA